MREKFQLFHGDCLEEMKNIEDGIIDLILCDLPYGTTDRHGLDSEKKENRVFSWDSVIPLDLLWEQYRRILKSKGTVVLTADQPFTSQLVMSNLEWFKYEWIWFKNKTVGFLLANYRPMKQTEDILVFSPVGASASSAKSGKSMTYNPQGLIPKTVKKKNNPKRLGVILHNPEHMGKGNKLLTETEYEQKWTNYPSEVIECPLDDERLHPTQKPVVLMEYLIRTYSNENELVLDNCMGSGTTGVACGITDRNFIGIEIDEEFFKISKRRIEEAYHGGLKDFFDG
ncbi:cytosine methyltransferase [archaeon]|nr:cytosine methyltransferase [archaeon]|tara:strand:- start:4386 stop:5237 length:852 start_codon:yes stop_codon:yes gene_type:complete